MKNVERLFSVGLITVFLAFNASLAFSQSKVKTVKIGSIYIGNLEKPRQIAAYGTPAWLFKTVFISFNDNKTGGLLVGACVYSINTYTGGLGYAMTSDNSKSISFSYKVKDGKVYIWNPDEGEPKNESGYSLVFKIENDCLVLVKSKTEDLKPSMLYNAGNYNNMQKMSPSEYQQFEINIYSKLLRNREINQEQGLDEKKKIEQQEQRRKAEGRQGQRSLKELEEKLEIFRQQAEAKRKREADSIAHIQDSIAHIQELIENYSSCRFLFETADKNFISDEDFISFITQENQATIEDEIMSLIHLKMNEISSVIVKGTEFKDQYHATNEMGKICAIPNSMRNVSPAIANFTENKIIEFVANRKKLNNAYNRVKRKNPDVKCSEFLQTYINEKQW